jgi:hypothetical protein
MSNGIECLVSICKAANQQFKGWTLKDFEDHLWGEISSTCEVCGVLGLTRRVESDWNTMPHLHELLVEQAALKSEDRASSACNSIDNDPNLLRTIFIAAGWDEENEADIFEFVCNVLKVLGLVVGGPSDDSWKPTTRLRNLVMSRLVRSLKPDVLVIETESSNDDDRDRRPDEGRDGEEECPNYSSEENRPDSIFKRRNQMVVRTRQNGVVSISRLSGAKRSPSSA